MSESKVAHETETTNAPESGKHAVAHDYVSAEARTLERHKAHWSPFAEIHKSTLGDLLPLLFDGDSSGADLADAALHSIKEDLEILCLAAEEMQSYDIVRTLIKLQVSAFSLGEARAAYERACKCEELFEKLRPQLEYMSKGKAPRKMLPIAARALLREIQMLRHHGGNLQCIEENRADGVADGNSPVEILGRQLTEHLRAQGIGRDRPRRGPAKVIPLFGERGPFAGGPAT